MAFFAASNMKNSTAPSASTSFHLDLRNRAKVVKRDLEAGEILMGIAIEIAIGIGIGFRRSRSR